MDLFLIAWFSRNLWHSMMMECKGIFCVFLHRAEGHATHLLFQQKLTGRTFLSSTPKIQWYVERNLFKYYGLSLEALKPLFDIRGGTHPGPEPR
jgi:hypothetical protein